MADPGEWKNENEIDDKTHFNETTTTLFSMKDIGLYNVYLLINEDDHRSIDVEEN